MCKILVLPVEKQVPQRLLYYSTSSTGVVRFQPMFGLSNTTVPDRTGLRRASSWIKQNYPSQLLDVPCLVQSSVSVFVCH